jgi:hypothetical protein
MKKRIIEDIETIDTDGGMTFIDLTNKYSEVVGEIMNDYENVHDIRVTCESYEYNDGENIAQELVIHFKRNETNDEYEKRKSMKDFYEKETRKRELMTLKELIGKYTDIAKEYINELNK